MNPTVPSVNCGSIDHAIDDVILGFRLEFTKNYPDCNLLINYALAIVALEQPKSENMPMSVGNAGLEILWWLFLLPLHLCFFFTCASLGLCYS